jgi:predicted enzyme related to lactoylglutathione lyase
MNRLLYVIALTPDLERMKRFYQDAVGLDVVVDSPAFVSFNTGGASLALIAIPRAQKREIELCFDSDDVDADVQALAARGVKFVDEPKTVEFGRVAHARDPEGNVLSLLAPTMRPAAGTGPALTAAVLHCRDLVAAKAFYRDRIGLGLGHDAPWWVEFELGGTNLALHPLVDHEVLEANPARPISLAFSAGDFDEWVEELGLRGVTFSQGITDRGYGRFAEAADPDGNLLAFRDSPAPPTLEEKLAEDYEGEDEPRQVAIRRQVTKNAKAVSRVAVKPEYHVAPATRPAAPATTPVDGDGTRAGLARVALGASKAAARKPRHTKKAPSVRGAGPVRTRKKPRKSGDPERVKARPASGHQKSAAARSLGTQAKSKASASRAKAVKRAAKPAKRAAARPAKRTSQTRPRAKAGRSRASASRGRR